MIFRFRFYVVCGFRNFVFRGKYILNENEMLENEESRKTKQINHITFLWWLLVFPVYYIDIYMYALLVSLSGSDVYFRDGFSIGV